MERYDHSIYIVVADKPLNLKLHDYYERTNTSISSSQERWLFIYRTVGDDSCKIYRCDVTGWEGEKQAAYQRKFTKIFNSTDILWDFMNYGEITEETIPSYYDDGFIGLSPMCREEDYANMRVITNCQIVELKNESNIILEELATNQDIAKNTKFIDIDGSIQEGSLPEIIGRENIFLEPDSIPLNWEVAKDVNTVNITTVTQIDNIHRKGSGQNIKLSDELIANLIELTPDKIKAGETILGITGTYTGEDVSL